jgi:hypothetical protein
MTDPRERLRERRSANLHAAALQLEEGAAAMRASVTPEPGEDVPPVPGAGSVSPAAGAAPEPAPVPFSSEQREEYDPGPRAGEYGADWAPVESLRTPDGQDPRRDDLSGRIAPPAPSSVVLDWRSRHDPESRNYGVRQRLTASAPLTNVLLSTGPALDQGAEGACVGFGGVDAGNVLRLVARPGTRELLGASDAEELYRLAQKRDQVPGESYEGTSVLGGMKAGVELGLWGGYLWAFGTRDIAQALLQRRGPVVIGVPWFAGMYDTGPRGKVVVSGPPVGGHCLAVVGLQLTGPNGEPGVHFVWQNSWGPSYGDEGLGYIANADLVTLLHSQGEAAIPTPGPQVSGR